MIPIFEQLRSLLIWLLVLPVFLLCCLLLFAVALVYQGPRLEPMIKGCCRIILFLCGIRLRIEGRENIIPGRQYIVMMNHVNFFDPLVLYAGLPIWARGVEEESHFHWPAYGPMIRRLGMIPISRKDTPRAMASLKRAAELIRRKMDFSFIVLPEGTRTRDGRLGAFKRGGFFLALETGLDILPLVQVGAARINRRGSRLVRPGELRLIIAPPVSIAGHSKANLGDLIEDVRTGFKRRLGEE
jgi:1-acyl-sn-glycerol-3-phosphate acyltransferase